MWEKIISFFISQGLLGIAIVCLGSVLALVYREAKKEREENKKERNDRTDKFVNIAVESVKYIQENSMTLKDLREEMKKHSEQAQDHRRVTESSLEKLLVMMDAEIKNRGRG